MAVMKTDNAIKRGDIDFQYADNIVAVKWYDKSVKIPVPCPLIVKEYNNGMSGVDLLEQRTAAYKLDRKSSNGPNYLRLFFKLMDNAVVNSCCLQIYLS